MSNYAALETLSRLHDKLTKSRSASGSSECLMRTTCHHNDCLAALIIGCTKLSRSVVSITQRQTTTLELLHSIQGELRKMDTTFSLRTTLGDVHLDADYSKKDVGSGFVCGDTGLNSQIRSSSCTMNGMTCSAKAWNETMDQRLGQMEALIQVQHQELLSIQDKIARIPDDLNLSCDQVSAREQSLTSAFLQDDEAEMMLSGVLCRLHDMYGDLCHRLDLEKHRVSSLATRLESKASIEVETEVKQQSTQLCHIQRFIDANWEVDLMDIRRKQDQLLSHLEERARVDESMIVTQSPSLTSLTELTSSPLGVFSFGSLQCPAESEDTRTLMARWCHDRQHVGLLALRAELLERMTNTMQLSLPTKPCRATTTVGASSDNPSQCGTSQREVRVTCLRRYQPQNYGKVLVLRCLKKLRKDLSKLNACHVDLVHLVGAVDYLDIATESAGVGLSIAPILDVNENRQMSSNSRDQHHEAKLIFADDLVKAQHIKENFRTKGNRHPAFDSQAQQPRKEKPAPPARREGSADRVSGLDSGFPLLHTPETQFEVSVRDASHATQFTSGTVLALAQRSSRSESIEERPPHLHCLSCQSTYQPSLPNLSTRRLVRAAGFKSSRHASAIITPLKWRVPSPKSATPTRN